MVINTLLQQTTHYSFKARNIQLYFLLKIEQFLGKNPEIDKDKRDTELSYRAVTVYDHSYRAVTVYDHSYRAVTVYDHS